MKKEIKYSDNTKNILTVFSAKDKSDVTFICLPAMGVRASFYENFAENLSELNYNVVTADWRGQGKSSVRASRAHDFGYEDIIGDIKETIDYANAWFPNTKKVIVGHSLGGQLGSLYASRYADEISGLILITSCNVHYKGWEKGTAMKLRFAGNVFYPVSRVIGHFPGIKIGFGGKEARTVMKDWCSNALSGKYEIANSSYDYESALNKMSKPVLSISVENDTLASKRAVENLYNKFSTTATISHVHLNSSKTGIKPLNHFSWAKEPAYFTNLVKNWTQKHI